MTQKFSNTLYWVEANESGKGKIVPHTRKETGDTYYKFMDRSQAKKFRDELIEYNTDTSFRLVKLTETYSFEKFYSVNDLEPKK